MMRINTIDLPGRALLFPAPPVCASYSDRVKGKVVVVTGAANGIGKATALLFAKYGANVVIGDVDVAGGERTISEIKEAGGQGTFLRCNVLQWEDLVALFEGAQAEYGAVDIVVPNAGITEVGHFATLLTENGRPVKPNMKTLEMNLISVIWTTNLAVHYLKINPATECKAIILIGSMASWQAIPGGEMYSAAKHGILGFMRSLHIPLLSSGIRVGAIHPWYADTGIVPTLTKVFLAGIPWTPVDRVAAAILYAATDPDPDTSGSAWLLPDDGPVFLLTKETLREGVYGMLDTRTKAVFKGLDGATYTARITKDLWKALGGTKILAAALVVAAARFAWKSQR
ncbi:hypothetical protein PLICRDRAFT_37424 [Plicaturopsis crispa FD-325 SS-3]|nr:hypothetical protein PLICRDRAFT_37424 [Plicaturopsis crispa FD-325 SS-3]